MMLARDDSTGILPDPGEARPGSREAFITIGHLPDVVASSHDNSPPCERDEFGLVEATSEVLIRCQE
jgi:hypothetical protein